MRRASNLFCASSWDCLPLLWQVHALTIRAILSFVMYRINSKSIGSESCHTPARARSQGGALVPFFLFKYTRLSTMWCACSFHLTALTLALTAVAVACALWFVQHSTSMIILTDIGNAYAGHLVCSVVFGTKRSLDSVLSAELTFPPLRYGRQIHINRTSRCVETSWSADPSKESRSVTYCWLHERLGCQRMVEGTTSNENWRNLFPAHFQIHHRMETT